MFKDEQGQVQGATTKLHIKPGSQPKFNKARPVAYSLQKKVEDEIDRLVAVGVLRPIEISDCQHQLFLWSNMMAQ